MDDQERDNFMILKQLYHTGHLSNQELERAEKLVKMFARDIEARRL